MKKIVSRTKNVLCASGSDDDLSTHGSYPDLYSRITVLRKLSSQYLVKLREKHAISHEL